MRSKPKKLLQQLAIYPYRKYSASAKLLATKLGVKLRYQPKEKFIINWGNNKDLGIPMVNTPDAVHAAANKLSTFQHLEGLSVVPWTIKKAEANGWLQSGKRVVARSLLRASEGRGITIVGPQDLLPDARLYTQYVPKQREYRVHVVGNEVIDIQEKRKRIGAESSLIRSHGDYVFCRENIQESKDLRQLCIKAIQQLGLDFGAVDAIWNEKSDRTYLLEVNTAPGLTDTTAGFYANAFKKRFNIG